MSERSKRRLLLLSNSRNYDTEYLEHAEGAIGDYLGKEVREVLFVPWAGVTIEWDDYTHTVGERFAAMGYGLVSIHTQPDPVAAVEAAEAISVGGGNTFALLREMQRGGVLEAIRRRVAEGVPYMGWSAGSNVACPTIRTTNDMPIVEPESFEAIGAVPFQINPHYTDAVLPRHRGETRGDRIAEFIRLNPDVWVAGLREGSMLRIEGMEITLLGGGEMRIFRHGEAPREVTASESLGFLLEG